MCTSHSDHVSLFIGLHLQALSDKDCPVCKHGKRLYVHSEQSLFGMTMSLSSLVFICRLFLTMVVQCASMVNTYMFTQKKACLVYTMREEYFLGFVILCL